MLWHPHMPVCIKTERTEAPLDEKVDFKKPELPLHAKAVKAETYRPDPKNPITLPPTPFELIARQYILKNNPFTTGDDLVIAAAILLYIVGFASSEQEALALVVGSDMAMCGFLHVSEVRLHNMVLYKQWEIYRTRVLEFPKLRVNDLKIGFKQPEDTSLEGQGKLLEDILNGVHPYERRLLSLQMRVGPY